MQVVKINRLHLARNTTIKIKKANVPIWCHYNKKLEWADNAGNLICHQNKPRYTWQDKAGEYAIQECSGALFIKRISGDYYNVVCLPLSRLYKELEKIGGM